MKWKIIDIYITKIKFKMDYFQNLNIDNVCNEITSETYFNLNSAISNQTVENIKKELSLWNFKINKNDILPSKTFNGWYHSMAIAKSKTVCDIVTSKTLLDICTKYIGPEFRLKAHRVYSTLSGAKMPWHSDDKLISKKKLQRVNFYNLSKRRNERRISDYKG